MIQTVEGFIIIIFFVLFVNKVRLAIQQTGHIREKRGYKQIRGFPIKDVTSHENNARPSNLPSDPLYPKEWYIVSDAWLKKRMLVTAWIMCDIHVYQLI